MFLTRNTVCKTSCAGLAERGGVGHHHQAAAESVQGGGPGDPGPGGQEYGQVSTCLVKFMKK